MYYVTQRLPVYTHSMFGFLTQFVHRKWKNLNEWYLHVLVCRDLFHAICLRTLNVIFKVTKTEGQRSRESLFNLNEWCI
jgi:hypothetical protein